MNFSDINKSFSYIDKSIININKCRDLLILRNDLSILINHLLILINDLLYNTSLVYTKAVTVKKQFTFPVTFCVNAYYGVISFVTALGH